MSQWDELYQGHPVWQLADQIEPLLASVTDPQDALVEGYLDRLRFLRDALRARRDLDARGVNLGVLDNLQPTVQQVINHLTHYLADPTTNASNLQVAATTATNDVWSYLQALPTPTVAADAKAARKGADADRASATKAVAELQAQVRALSAQLTQAAQEVAAQRTEVATSVAEIGQKITETDVHLADAVRQVDAAVATQTQVFDARVTEQITRLETAVTTQQSAFETAQSERSAAAIEQTTTMNEQATAAIAQINAAGTKQAEVAQSRATALLQELERLRETAAGVVNATGQLAITTEYGQYAQDQRKQAWRWSVATVGFALAGFIALFVVLTHLHPEQTSWQLAIYKLSASFILIGIATYSGRQAADHRREERDAKRTQLDVNALEPFLSLIPEEKRADLRAAVVERLFVRTEQVTRPVATDTAETFAQNLGTATGEALRRAGPAATV